MDVPSEAPDPAPTGGRLGRWLGCYLPAPLRRWYVYLPLDGLLLLSLCVGLVCGLSLRVSGAPYFADEVTDDAREQLAHLEGLLRTGSKTGRLDLIGGYSKLCGYSNEWRQIYYVFHAMVLAEWARLEPEHQDEAVELLTLCARGVLRVPDEVQDEATLRQYLAERVYGRAPIQAGYEALVLGARRRLTEDTSFDEAQRRNTEALAAYLDGCLIEGAEETFWTSDQALQVHSLWLSDQRLGSDFAGVTQRWGAAMEARFLDAEGLLRSEVGVGPQGDQVVTPPMGSSLTWTVLFLADPLPELARRQYEGFCAQRERRLFSFGATLEHDSYTEMGDTNSGPLVPGFSPAATGFALAAHKLQGEPDRFARALRVFEMFGQPQTDAEGQRFYYLGNAMGDAILLYAKLARAR